MIAGVLEIQIMAGLARISEDMRKAERIVGDSMAKVEKSARSARTAMETLTAGFGAMMALQQIKQMSDAYTKMDAQLRISTKNQQEYNRALADVQVISTVAQANIGATTMLYTRLLNVTKDMNIGQGQVSNMTKTVSYGLKAFGASAAEASSASLQLSQAMGANRLGGEEFRAVMEAMPNVMKVLANSMGVPLGELRALSIAGKITADQMLKAWGNPEMAAQMEKLARESRAIGGELVVMSNNAMQFVGSLMKMSGAQGGAIGLISGMSEVLKLAVTYVAQITSLLITLAALYAGRFVTGLVQARLATMAMNAAQVEATAMNLAAAQSTATYTWARHVSTGGTMANAAANKVLVATQVELAAAEALHAQATMTWMGKLRAFAAANMLGLIGLALWGIYTVADQLGWIDKLSNKLGDFFNTQESHIRRLKELAGGGVSGDAMSRAIETVASREAAKAAADAQSKMLSEVGISGPVGAGNITAYIDKLTVELAALDEKRKRWKNSEYGTRETENITRAIATLKEYRKEMDKLAEMHAKPGTFAFSSGWMAESEKYMTKAEKYAAAIAKITAEYGAEMAKLQQTSDIDATQRAKLQTVLDAERARRVAALKEPKVATAAAVQGMSMMGKMAEEMTAKNIRDTSAMTNVQKVAAAWKKANDNIEAARANNATAKQIANMYKVRGTAVELQKAQYDADAADADLEVKRSVDRVKDIDKIIAARQRERDTYGMNAIEIAQYDDAALKIEQDKLWYQIQSTDNLTLQLALLKEIDKFGVRRVEALTPTDAERASAWNASTAGRATNAGSSAATSAFFMDNGKSFTDNFANTLKAGLEPAFQKLIATLILNTFVLEKSAATTSGDWVMAIVALVATQFGNEARTLDRNTTITGSLAGATGGTKNENMQMDSQWFEAQRNWTIQTGLSRAELNAYTASIVESRQIMIVAGNALGYVDTEAKSLSFDLTIAGDVTKGLTQSIGSSLLPALVLFQREGESLNETAKRLTDTFKSTGDLITALGVSSTDAFGGMGLQSAAAREALVAASGGLSAFTSNSKSFIDNFLTNAEKLAPAADEVARTFDRLGIVGVSTNEQFAQLVKEQMALGNTSVVGELLSVAGAFNSLTESAAAANEQINGILAKETFSTMVDWLRASKTGGSAAALIANASAGLDIAGEQAGTAAYEAANAAAIAAANAAITSTTTDETTTGVSKFDEFWIAFRDGFGAILAQIVAPLQVIELILKAIKMVLDVVWIFIQTIWGAIRLVIDKIAEVLNEIWLWIKPVWDSIYNVLNSVWQAIKDVWQAIKDVFGGGGGGAPGGDLNPINWFANGGTFGTHAFADGSAFTDGLYSSPTSFMFANGNGFSNGVMGEAGPEAVMPLKRDSSGRLGVSLNGGGNGGIIAELQAMRNELTQLRAESRSERAALVGTSQRTERIIDKWDHNGMPAVTTL